MEEYDPQIVTLLPNAYRLRGGGGDCVSAETTPDIYLLS